MTCPSKHGQHGLYITKGSILFLELLCWPSWKGHVKNRIEYLVMLQAMLGTTFLYSKMFINDANSGQMYHAGWSGKGTLCWDGYISALLKGNLWIHASHAENERMEVPYALDFLAIIWIVSFLSINYTFWTHQLLTAKDGKAIILSIYVLCIIYHLDLAARIKTIEYLPDVQ